MRALLVEDEALVALIAEEALAGLGFQVHAAATATEALEAFEQGRPDLAVIDIGLPDMLGWKVLDELKASDLREQVRIIVITAYGDPANRLMGKLQDVDTYLVKPFSPDEIERVVRRVLAPPSEETE